MALILLPFVINAQNSDKMHYEPSEQYPYGRLNPKAPKALADYSNLIGICDCKSETKNADGTWGEAENMTWMFKYIMNGTAIQDQSLKESGIHSGSIRQYSLDSAKWYVHYYSSNKITSTSHYHGDKADKDIILYKIKSDFTTPDGIDLFYRLKFTNISENGFSWAGDWVDVSAKPDKVLGNTWKITCVKR